MKLNKNQEQLLRNFVKKSYSKANMDYQTFDFESEIDSSLTYQENKRLLIERLKQLGVISEVMEKTGRQMKAELEHFERDQLEREEQHYKEELEKSLEDIKKNAVDVSEFYGNLPKLLEMVKLGLTKSLFVIGEPASGKTTQVETHLENAVVISGHISPLKLYQKLYENKKGKIIFFDDTEDMMNDKATISILKQALDTREPRIVMWNTTKDMGTLPSFFPFESSVVFTVNEIPNDMGMKAILSRSEKFMCNFDYGTYLKIMYSIAKKPLNNIPTKKLVEIVDYIKENSDETTEDFNLRTLMKITNYYIFDKNGWKELAKDLLSRKIDELQLVKELIMSGKTVNEQVKMFNELTGRKRATYFNIKKRLSVGKSKV